MNDDTGPALQTALAYYEAWTSKDLDRVESAPAAECVTVRDGKMVYSRFIFDRAPFQAARRAE